MDKSKYLTDETVTQFSRWLIEHTTNLNVNSLSSFQETVVEGIVIGIIMLSSILLISMIKGK